MNGSAMTPDQWAALGSLFFIIAIVLGVVGIVWEYRRSGDGGEDL